MTTSTSDASFASPAPKADVEDWRQLRRHNLRKMRKQVRTIVLMMAFIEALRVGPMQIVYAGRQGYPAPGDEDFGIGYTVGYILSWLYVCVFMIIFIPLFSWWVPLSSSEDPDQPSLATKLLEFFKKLDLMFLLPVSIAISLVTYFYYLVQTFIHVDSRPVGSNKYPKNTRKNWLVRFFMLLGIAISTSCGYGTFQILAATDLAHVKPLEYAVIVAPVQINIGILLGTLMQFKMEKRIKRKQALQLQSVKLEEGPADEKAALLQEV